MQTELKEYLRIEFSGAITVNDICYLDSSTLSIRGLDDERYILVDNQPVEVYNVDIKIELKNCKISNCVVNDGVLNIHNGNISNSQCNNSTVKITNGNIKNSTNRSCTVSSYNSTTKHEQNIDTKRPTACGFLFE